MQKGNYMIGYAYMALAVVGAVLIAVGISGLCEVIFE